MEKSNRSVMYLSVYWVSRFIDTKVLPPISEQNILLPIRNKNISKLALIIEAKHCRYTAANPSEKHWFYVGDINKATEPCREKQGKYMAIGQGWIKTKCGGSLAKITRVPFLKKCHNHPKNPGRD